MDEPFIISVADAPALSHPRRGTMLDFVSETMFREGTAREGEVGGFLVTDSVDEAVAHIDRMARAGA